MVLYQYAKFSFWYVPFCPKVWDSQTWNSDFLQWLRYKKQFWISVEDQVYIFNDNVAKTDSEENVGISLDSKLREKKEKINIEVHSVPCQTS